MKKFLQLILSASLVAPFIYLIYNQFADDSLFGDGFFEILFVGFSCLILMIISYVVYALNEPERSIRLVWGTICLGSVVGFFCFWGLVGTFAPSIRFRLKTQETLTATLPLLEKLPDLTQLTQSGDILGSINGQLIKPPIISYSDSSYKPMNQVLLKYKLDSTHVSKLLNYMIDHDIYEIQRNTDKSIKFSVKGRLFHYSANMPPVNKIWQERKHLNGPWYQENRPFVD